MVLPSFKPDSGINKGTVSRNLKALTAERYRGMPLVTEYETSDGKVYEVSYSIKQELLQNYSKAGCGRELQPLQLCNSHGMTCF